MTDHNDEGQPPIEEIPVISHPIPSRPEIRVIAERHALSIDSAIVNRENYQQRAIDLKEEMRHYTTHLTPAESDAVRSMYDEEIAAAMNHLTQETLRQSEALMRQADETEARTKDIRAKTATLVASQHRSQFIARIAGTILGVAALIGFLYYVLH